MSYDEIYRIVVIELGYNAEYFFDKMSYDELNLILENYQYRYRNEYEMNRLTNYIIAQSNSTKQLKLTDISIFNWDNEKVEKEVITKIDVEKMHDKGNEFVEKLMKNKIEI